MLQESEMIKRQEEIIELVYNNNSLTKRLACDNKWQNKSIIKLGIETVLHKTKNNHNDEKYSHHMVYPPLGLVDEFHR